MSKNKSYLNSKWKSKVKDVGIFTVISEKKLSKGITKYKFRFEDGTTSSLDTAQELEELFTEVK